VTAAATRPAETSAILAGRREVLVHSVTHESDGVVRLTLVDPSGSDLPGWAPGAHLNLVLPSQKVRQYSLCGPAEDTAAYHIAVLREPDGRGGSAEIHETGLVGRRLTIQGPRNHFPLVDADDYLFIAGGIGITPILPMIRAVQGAGASWRLLYGGRTRSSMAFRDALGRYGERVTFVPQDEQGHPPLAEFLSEATPTAAVYCCGPSGLLTAVEKCCRATGCIERLHTERFTPPPATGSTPVSTEDTDGIADSDNEISFEVELRRSGATVTVPVGCTILERVRDVVPDVLSSCEEGYCGTCETRVLDGTPLHRDTILSEAERRRNDTMMICVGRSRTERLVLDL
jgi:ferredoxin-NADP reductase